MDTIIFGMRDLHLDRTVRKAHTSYVHRRANRLHAGEYLVVQCKEYGISNQYFVGLRLYRHGALIATATAYQWELHLAIRNAFNSLEHQLEYKRAIVEESSMGVEA